MSPTVRVYEDPEAREAARKEIQGWIELHQRGDVTEDETVEMIKQAFVEPVRTEPEE